MIFFLVSKKCIDNDDDDNTKKALLAAVIVLAIILILENIIMSFKCYHITMKSEKEKMERGNYNADNVNL